MKKNYTLSKNRDFLATLFCRLVVIITLVLLVINGIIFIQYLFGLVKEDIHNKTIQSSY